MKRLDKIVLFLVCVLSTFSAFANEAVNFTASAPDVVPNGSPFQLVYTVNASSKDLRVPEMPDFDVVAGPFTSQSRSMQIVNGNMSSTVTIRYTYTLVPKKEGTFTIAAASIVVDKQKYQSNSLSIKVLPAEETTSTQQSSANNNQQVTVSQQITNENLFILPIVSRYKIREQEYTLVTYKIYSKVDLLDIQSPKFPDFKGFMVQEIDLPQNKRISLENYKGKNYNTVILRQYLL
ncbi:MAG: BatD family protein, partial [Paludibacteraceae bacterium]|nr:BatD family protein [Paludibacteraceae bacterium]